MRQCSPQAPLIQLDPAGKPALLNYNLPQSTVYEAISFVDLDLAATKFSAAALAITDGSYWNSIPAGTTADTLKNRLLNGDSSLIFNAHLLPLVPILETPTQPTGGGGVGGVVSRVATNTLYASATVTPTVASDSPKRTIAYRFDLPMPQTEETIAQQIFNGYMPVIKLIKLMRCGKLT